MTSEHHRTLTRNGCDDASMTTTTTVRPDLPLAFAERLAKAAIASAVEEGLKISVVVADAAGFPVTVLRMDGAARMTVGVATTKAHTAAAYDMETGFLGTLQEYVPELVSTMRVTAPVTALPGGVPIRTAEGRTIGAIGVSGGTGEQDVACVTAALAAVSLTAS
jgi:uncharacterized protein GlcG (DUF336 family)